MAICAPRALPIRRWDQYRSGRQAVQCAQTSICSTPSARSQWALMPLRSTCHFAPRCSIYGSAAAPTAGLHFTKELLEKIAAKGVKIAYVTLHVGLGTFRPVKAEEITEHHMHSEFCMMDAETAEILNETRRSGGRIVCCGTTSCRTVESLVQEDGRFRESSKWTEIFIYPGYKFRAMDALITNFHLPESTLVMLVSAFAGREHILHAYETAVQERYRFFSFGDAMFIADGLTVEGTDVSGH